MSSINLFSYYGVDLKIVCISSTFFSSLFYFNDNTIHLFYPYLIYLYFVAILIYIILVRKTRVSWVLDHFLILLIQIFCYFWSFCWYFWMPPCSFGPLSSYTESFLSKQDFDRMGVYLPRRSPLNSSNILVQPTEGWLIALSSKRRTSFYH